MMTTEEKQAKAHPQSEAMTKAMLGGLTGGVHILVDGEEHVANPKSDCVLFEKDGRVWGVMRDKIKSRGLAARDETGFPVAATLVWEANGEIKSVELRAVPQGEWAIPLPMVLGTLGI